MKDSFTNPFFPAPKKQKTTEKARTKPKKQVTQPAVTNPKRNEPAPPLPRTDQVQFEDYLYDDDIHCIGNVDDDASADGSDTSDAEEGPEGAGSPQPVAESYFLHLHKTLESRGKLIARGQSALKDAVAAADACLGRTCPTCGAESSGAALSCPVTILTWDQPVDVEVPVYYCANCRMQYGIRPTAVDCLHDAMPGWDVSTRRDGVAVVWWHQGLLQQFDLLTFYTRHVSADRFCAAMMHNWGCNGFQDPDVATTCLRKRLRQALMLYHYLQAMEEDYPEGLSGWPQGALNSCACCGDVNTSTSTADGQVVATAADAGIPDGEHPADLAPGAAAPVVVDEVSPSAGASSTGNLVEEARGPGVLSQRADGNDVARSGAAQPNAEEQPVDDRAKEMEWARYLWTSSVDIAGPGPATLHSVHFDANFKLDLLPRPRYHKTYIQLQRRRFFISNAVVLSAIGDDSAAQDIGPNHCSNFHADRAVAPISKQKLVTATGVALCRHGILLRLLNLFTGERHAYSTTAVQSLLAAGTAVQYGWYDNACRWSRSYEKWLEQQDPAVKAAGRSMQCLIPPWHVFAHSYTCQKAFGHRHVDGAGRGTGEPAEIFNSIVGGHGKCTRYMTPANRESHLERVSRLYSRQVVLGMPHRLWRMQVRAEAAMTGLPSRIAALERSLAEARNETVEQVQARAAAAAVGAGSSLAAAGSSGDNQGHWGAEYVRLRLALSDLERTDGVEPTPGALTIGLLLPGSEAVTLRQRPGLIRSVRGQVSSLEAAHEIVRADWQPGSHQFERSRKELVRCEEKKLCSEIEAAGMDYFSLERVVQHLSGRKKEQQQALRDKRIAKQRLHQLWEQLRVWCAQPGSRMTTDQLAAIRAPGAIQAALRQRYPWDAAASSTGPLTRQKARLVRLKQDLDRCSEERSLIGREMKRAVEYYTARTQILESRIARGVHESERLLLEKHLSFNRRMLGAFDTLSKGGVPEDVSRLPYLDDRTVKGR